MEPLLEVATTYATQCSSVALLFEHGISPPSAHPGGHWLPGPCFRSSAISLLLCPPWIQPAAPLPGASNTDQACFSWARERSAF